MSWWRSVPSEVSVQWPSAQSHAQSYSGAQNRNEDREPRGANDASDGAKKVLGVHYIVAFHYHHPRRSLYRNDCSNGCQLRSVGPRSSHVRYRVGSHSGCVHVLLVNSATIICVTTSALGESKNKDEVISPLQDVLEKGDTPSKRTRHAVPRITSRDKLSRVQRGIVSLCRRQFVHRSNL